MWLVKPCGYNWRDVISIVSQSEGQNSCWWANKAIIRERHPIPTIDEVIKDVREGNIFSKSDLKWSYHQVQLISCGIKTFVTNKGMLFVSRSFNKCWNIALERQTLQMTSSSMVPNMVLTELNMTSDWRKCWPRVNDLSLIHIWRCRRSTLCRSRWSPYH